jgi:mono/diheme cytochrome c family protein
MNPDPKNGASMPDDEAEPTAGYSPAPIALIILFAVLVYWGMLYLDDHGGGFNKQVYQPYESYAIVADRQPILDPVTKALKDGEKLYAANCETCHQKTGSGTPGGCPPLANSDWAAGGGPNRIIRLVLDGGTGPIKISGKDYTPSATMLSFRGSLKDEQIADVLSYVRNSFGNKADIVKPDQVAKIRDATSTHHGPWPPSDLLQIPDKD